MSIDVVALAARIRALPGVTGKAAIGAVTEAFGAADWWSGPGDDGAVVDVAGNHVVVGGEAMLPEFVRADPRGAGIAAVVANVNDLAAMGAVPLALVDTVIGSREHNKQVLAGLKWASDLYRVPVVGGHLTESDDATALSAFGLGHAPAVLSAANTAVGQELLLACCIQGDMNPNFLFFRSFAHRSVELADDVRIFAQLAGSGAAVAAKDVSMAGMIGSLAMLLEPHRLGITVALDRVPVPVGVELDDWLCCFPSFAFLLTTPTDRLAEAVAVFEARGLTAAHLGTLDDSGQVALATATEREIVFDLTRESVTHLAAGLR